VKTNKTPDGSIDLRVGTYPGRDSVESWQSPVIAVRRFFGQDRLTGGVRTKKISLYPLRSPES
jgi:hypothetical protein